MATIAERILDAIRHRPLDDDQLARQLNVRSRQSINQVARRLESDGRLHRRVGSDGKIVNVPVDPTETSQRSSPQLLAKRPQTPAVPEDVVKRAVSDYLKQREFDVAVAWGRTRGIDIDARHHDGRRYIIEAKAGVGHSGAQQANYFLGAIGELVQRMSDPDATYALALPDNHQYRSLVTRLPGLARARLGLVVFWVHVTGNGTRVELDQ